MKNKQKLFENVGGNQFKLITESMDPNSKVSMVREGLKKVFSSASKELSYKRVANVGLGYIKDVSEAKKCAIQEARELAPQYGYSDNETMQKFVKEEIPSGPANSNSDELGVDKIKEQIISLCESYLKAQKPRGHNTATYLFSEIETLANQLISK